MLELKHLDIFFQIVVLLLAISFHESAHGWTASRYGDPTARMLGRVSLNPIRHIDLFGSIILPALLIIAGWPVFGWAKPTPVDPRNFKEPVKADIMTSVAGPVSNFILVAVGFSILAALLALSTEVRDALPFALQQMMHGDAGLSGSDLTPAFPITMFLADMILINVLLGIFNLVPLPPLDGSHVIMHLLPPEARRGYQMVGMIALVAFMFFGGRILWMLMSPVLSILFGSLLRIHG